MTLDLAFGGAFYDIIESLALDLKVDNKDLPQIKIAASIIKTAIEANMKVIHPEEAGLHGIYGIMFLNQLKQKEVDLRNVTILLMNKLTAHLVALGSSYCKAI